MRARSMFGNPVGSLRAGLSAAALALLLLAAAASSSPAAVFKIEGFDGEVVDASGNPYSQAGGHPFAASARIEWGERGTDPVFGVQQPEQMAKRLTAELPPGLVGNPQATRKCTRLQLITGANNGGRCPLDTQVGLISLSFGMGRTWTPLYNIEPPAGSPAAFGFNFNSAPVMITASIRTGTDYGINLESRNISQGVAVMGSEVVLWGSPRSPAHDPFRFGQEGEERRACLSQEGGEEPPSQGDECHVSGPEIAMISNPSACTPPGVGLETRLDGESWREERDFASFVSHEPPGYPLPPEEWGPKLGPTGCADVPFAPSLRVEPTSKTAGAPTGLDVELTIPQDGMSNPLGLASSALKDTKVVLPQGMVLNPSSASGLEGCTPEQIGLTSAPGQTPVTFTSDPARCSDASKIGSLEIETPLLEESLQGSVHLAQQGHNPFGSLLAMYLAVHDPQTGVVVKLPGEIAADAATGRLTATFEENPQLPFETLTMKLASGARAPLLNPSQCGEYTVHAELTPWARPAEAVPSNSPVAISEGCGQSLSFDPRLEAGVDNPVAGKHSAFTLRVKRDDGQPNIASLEATLPQGLIAKLRGVPLCGEAEAPSGSCPAASQIGRVVVGAGVGSILTYVPEAGKAPTAVYLAGPYKGAPLSIVAMVPAQAGPFDLGTVTVRNALHVDPTTAQVSAKSDPLPQILQGIPIPYRDVRVEIDRSEFTLNPTSCDPMAVGASIGASNGASASPSTRFQVAGCGDLRFKPKLAMRFFGKTHRSAHPKLRATLTMPEGGANVRKAVVTMPKTQFLENAHIRTICTRVQWAAKSCPKAAIYGYAKAWTPLLDQPLQGPVYLRSSDNELPDLVADLDGQIEIDLVGRIDAVRERIRNTFLTVPDAPVSKFVLTMQGGKKGLLVNNTNLCKAKPRMNAKFTGQNGKVHRINPRVRISCGGKAEHRR